MARLRARRAERATLTSGDPMLAQLRDDLRYSLRVAARRPWLSLTIIATMALGVGTTTAVFSIGDALLLRRCRSPRPSSWCVLLRLSPTPRRRWS